MNHIHQYWKTAKIIACAMILAVCLSQQVKAAQYQATDKVQKLYLGQEHLVFYVKNTFSPSNDTVSVARLSETKGLLAAPQPIISLLYISTFKALRDEKGPAINAVYLARSQGALQNQAYFVRYPDDNNFKANSATVLPFGRFETKWVDLDLGRNNTYALTLTTDTTIELAVLDKNGAKQNHYLLSTVPAGNIYTFAEGYVDQTSNRAYVVFGERDANYKKYTLNIAEFDLTSGQVVINQPVRALGPDFIYGLEIGAGSGGEILVNFTYCPNGSFPCNFDILLRDKTGLWKTLVTLNDVESTDQLFFPNPNATQSKYNVLFAAVGDMFSLGTQTLLTIESPDTGQTFSKLSIQALLPPSLGARLFHIAIPNDPTRTPPTLNVPVAATTISYTTSQARDISMYYSLSNVVQIETFSSGGVGNPVVIPYKR